MSLSNEIDPRKIELLERRLEKVIGFIVRYGREDVSSEVVKQYFLSLYDLNIEAEPCYISKEVLFSLYFKFTKIVSSDENVFFLLYDDPGKKFSGVKDSEEKELKISAI